MGAIFTKKNKKKFMTKHEKFIKELCKLAIDVEPVGAARLAAGLVYKNEFISFGFNKIKSHPFQKRFGKNPMAIYLHAEIDCIRNATKQTSNDIISKSTLYVSRMKFEDSTRTNMTQGLACPCQGCQKAIVAFDIKKVYYSLNNDGIGIL